MSERRPHYPQLDGLRALAVLLVLLGHEMTEIPAGEVASAGVLLFFVLSGFLITTLLCNEERDTGAISLPAFYVRRTLRILPAMYLFLSVCAVLVAVGLITDTPWSNFGVAALYVRNIFGHGTTFGHLWSLSLEEQFYLTWPFIVIATPPRLRLKLAMAIIGAVVVWRGVATALHLFDYNKGIYYMRPDFRYDSILSGCAIALAFQEGRALAFFKSVPPLLSLGLLMIVSMVAPAEWAVPYLTTIETLFAVVFVTRLILVGTDPFARLLSTPPMRWLGRLSYSWYLWQQLFILTKTPDWGFVRRFPANLVFSFLAAVASHYLVEKPFLRLKDSFSARARPAAASPQRASA